jgi:ketosteroid isomerase-like protein
VSDHPNATILKAALAAFGPRDMATLSQLLADDIVWHTPGRNLLSGKRSGRDDVMAHLCRIVELTNGTYRTELIDILASDTRAAALYRATARRVRRHLDAHVLLLCDIHNNQITDAFGSPHDQHAFDAFFAPSDARGGALSLRDGNRGEAGCDVRSADEWHARRILVEKALFLGSAGRGCEHAGTRPNRFRSMTVAGRVLDEEHRAFVEVPGLAVT